MTTKLYVLEDTFGNQSFFKSIKKLKENFKPTSKIFYIKPDIIPEKSEKEYYRLKTLENILKN